jgi:hypothetical protein
VTLHLDGTILDLPEGRADLPQDLDPAGLQRGLSRVEEDLVHHLDPQPVLDPLDLDLAVRDLPLQAVDELVLGRAQLEELGLFLGDLRVQVGARAQELVAHRLEVGDPRPQGTRLLLRHRQLLAGGLKHELLGPNEPPVDRPRRCGQEHEPTRQPFGHVRLP